MPIMMPKAADSSVRLDTYLLAHIQYRAGGAFGERARTNVFAKRDKQTVNINPMFLRQFGFQGQHRLLRSAGFDIAPAIRHAMDVDIHTDNGLATGYAQRQIRTLRSHARKRQ